jgi:hypothetical protein
MLASDHEGSAPTGWGTLPPLVYKSWEKFPTQDDQNTLPQAERVACFADIVQEGGYHKITWLFPFLANLLVDANAVRLFAWMHPKE